MSTHRRRIQTIRALIAGSPLSSRPTYIVIDTEFSEVINAGRIRKNGRKQLLQVLHSTRALDTSLADLLAHHGIPVTRPSLGSYLYSFSNHALATLGHLPNIRRIHYQSAIVNVRNHYMHNAGAYPANNAEIQTLIAEMQNCMIEILAL